MEKPTAVVFRFPSAPPLEPVEIAAASVHMIMDRTAADLAVTTEELSLRLSNGQGRPLTLHQINAYKQQIARTRSLLEQLEEAASRIMPDTEFRDRM
jgi:hypothetical protein